MSQFANHFCCYSKQLWHIPLTVTTNNGTKVTHWMKRVKESKTLSEEIEKI